MNPTLVFSFVLLFGLSPLSQIAQTVPPLINYQGRLTDEAGGPLPSGTYSVQFRLWPAATGTTGLVWARQYEVAVVDGVFNVILGAPGGVDIPNANPAVIDLGLTFNSLERYLGIRIVRTKDGVVTNPREIQPRQQILSAPYAMHADRADRAALAADLALEIRDVLTPPGLVVAWMGTNNFPPAGWEFCWGQQVSRTGPKYARLFSVIGTSSGAGNGTSTFHLPDLRGMFLRGTDATGLNDPDYQSRSNHTGIQGPRVGSVQPDALKSHLHPLVGAFHNGYGGGGGTGFGIAFAGASSATGTNPEGRTETRPKNVYVHYLIKL